jgi:hypothetical protein
MPKLLLFAPCEKVLIDEQSKSISLIVVLQEIHYKLPPGAQIQPNAMLPIQWSVLTLWREEEPQDNNVEFEQQLSIETGAGTTLAVSEMKWKFTAPSHRIIAQVPGIPVSSRKINVKLAYRVVGVRDWISLASYPIELMQDVI